MSNVELKNQPKITLELVLKRRKSTLKNFINEAGVQNYSGLVELCRRLGVANVPEDVYNKEIKPQLVTSQQDGIVVIDVIESPVITNSNSSVIEKLRNAPYDPELPTDDEIQAVEEARNERKEAKNKKSNKIESNKGTEPKNGTKSTDDPKF